MLNYIYWNPKREIFVIPLINYPIVWYSVLFLVGFAAGYYIFTMVLKRYFFLFPKICDRDFISYDKLKKDLLNPKNDNQKHAAVGFSKKNATTRLQVLNFLNEFIDDRIKNRLFLEKAFSDSILSIKKKIIKFTDRLLVYVIIATVIGARAGHLFFYEKPQYYLQNPLIIIKTWKGGLASHGAAVAILIAVFVFSRSLKNLKPKLTYVHLLDFVCVPVAFAGFCIRLGNFVNQEVMGIKSLVPWAIVFENPMDNVPVVPRHPVQLYEAFFYLIVFFLLFYLDRKKYFLLKEGKLLALFLILVFTFRFFIEFLKVRESDLINVGSVLSMGQYLSIPFIIMGMFFLFWNKIASFFLKNNKSIE